MKSVLAGFVTSLVISTPLLGADGPVGPSQPDWPPPGGYSASANGPMQPASSFPSNGNGYAPAFRAPRSHPSRRYHGEAPVLPPDADWPDAAYGYADMVAPPQPGRPVQVIPPPSIPLEGDIMDTTKRPVRNWRPLGQKPKPPEAIQTLAPVPTLTPVQVIPAPVPTPTPVQAVPAPVPTPTPVQVVPMPLPAPAATSTP